jgi:predicted nucleic acid-binding protein
MLLVDSSVWVDFFNGRPTRETELLADFLGREPLMVGDLMLAEVLQGFRSERDFKVARDLMLTLDVVSLLSAPLAIESANNYRRLRRKGATVRKTTDCIIATWCIQHAVPLLHCDREFRPFEKHLGLEVV